MATAFGVAVSVAAAYVASAFNNIMDLLQPVFGFVNAPLLATFLLGMFWKRTTGHAAFFGLPRRHTGRRALSRALLLQWRPPWHQRFSDRAAFRFASARWARISLWPSSLGAWCFLLTMFISVLTRRQKSDAGARGLGVFANAAAHRRPCPLVSPPCCSGAIVVIASLGLNLSLLVIKMYFP